MKTLFSIASGCLALLLAPGCAIDTVPLPEDSANATSGAQIQTGRIYHSDNDPSVLLAGVSGAVRGADSLMVRNSALQSEHEVMVSPDGSFALVANATIGDQLDLTALLSGEAVATAQLTLVPGSVEAYSTEQDLEDAAAGGPPASMGGTGNISINADDTVTFSGFVDSGTLVIGVNLARSVSAQAPVLSDGSFELRIAGSSGEELLVFGVEPATSNGGGAPVTVLIP